MKPWFLHARLELYKGMVAQSWTRVFFVALFEIFGACTKDLNAIRYVELMGDHLHPFMLFCYPPGNGVFQQDNCSSHKSWFTTD
ncbi:uncharacterized protein TNCV_2825911 [Trichonephila clavipes]|nr:uncharacterized protein TNCV_2825911 [Trichonephila clavipes]